jgi:hypothetical protein
MTTAAELGRATVPWRCELHRGTVRRLHEADGDSQRRAARLSRLLATTVEGSAAWVSVEALIRVERDPDTALRPAVAVVEGPLPYDGVVDTGLLVVVETDPRRLELWQDAGVHTIWVPRSRGVVVSVAGTSKVLAGEQELPVPGMGSRGLTAADLSRVMAVTG